VSLVLDAVSFALFLVGGAFVFAGGLGVLRMPDLYTRMHPAGLTDTMGTILVLSGCLLQAGLGLATVKLAAILVFLLLTTPTAAYALANAARLAGIVPLHTAPDEENATR
jgi:multicomponent Na+:H+ antiporter subunit G